MGHAKISRSCKKVTIVGGCDPWPRSPRRFVTSYPLATLCPTGCALPHARHRLAQCCARLPAAARLGRCTAALLLHAAFTTLAVPSTPPRLLARATAACRADAVMRRANVPWLQLPHHVQRALSRAPHLRAALLLSCRLALPRRSHHKATGRV